LKANELTALFILDSDEGGTLALFQSHPTSHISKLGQVYAIGSRVSAK
jgi:hypothetical protein